MRVQFGGEFQPRKDFPFTAQIKMAVVGDHEASAEFLNPIPGRAEKGHGCFMGLFRSSVVCILLFMAVMIVPMVLHHVLAVFRGGCLIKNRRVVSAMKGDVCLDEEVVGKQAAGVPKQGLEHVLRIPLACPRFCTGLKAGREGEGCGGEQQKNEFW